MKAFEAKERARRYLCEMFPWLVRVLILLERPCASEESFNGHRIGAWHWFRYGEDQETPRHCHRPPSLRLGPPEAVSMSPASRSFTSGGCSRAFGDTCPVFPGPRNSLFPPGKGRLRGLRVLLVMSMGVLQRLQGAQCPIRGLSFLENANHA